MVRFDAESFVYMCMRVRAAEDVAGSKGCVRCSMQDVLDRAEAALRFGRARLLSSSTQVLGADAGLRHVPWWIDALSRHGEPQSSSLRATHAPQNDNTTLGMCINRTDVKMDLERIQAILKMACLSRRRR